jgi:hypothetical protein
LAEAGDNWSDSDGACNDEPLDQSDLARAARKSGLRKPVFLDEGGWLEAKRVGVVLILYCRTRKFAVG